MNYKKSYRLLPHYTIKNNYVVFLLKVPVFKNISDELAKKLISTKNILLDEISKKDLVIFQQLIQEGVVVECFNTCDVKKFSRKLFVQAHGDDCALSCGAFLAKLHVENCSSNVIATIFSNYSSEYFSWKESIDLTNERYSQIRQMEDELFVENIKSKILFLNFSESLLRGIKYPILPLGIFKKDYKVLESIFLKIKQIVDQYNINEIYLPMGIGWNCDHQILTEVAWKLKEYLHIYLYEDYPYCDKNRYGYWKRLAEVNDKIKLEPIYLDVTQHLAQKASFINFYKSQFKDWKYKDIKKEITELASSTALEAKLWHKLDISFDFAERIWQLT